MMIELNRSKAGRFSIKPTLRETLNNPNLQPSNKEAFIFSRDSDNLLECRIRYINESGQDLTIINSNGFSIDLPGDNTWKNRLVVSYTLQWGMHCDINAKALRVHLPNAEESDITEIINHIRTNPLEYGTNELDFFYVIDLEGIENDPYGIWIEDINVQVVSKQYAARTTFFTRDAFFNLDTELVKHSELIYSTGVSLNYFTNDINLTESLFVPLGNDSLEIKPIYYPGMQTGLYINLVGNAKFSASRNNRRGLYIAPEDYNLYGVYDSPRAYLEYLKSAKYTPKDRLHKLLNSYERFHDHFGDRKEDRLSLKDVTLFGDFTIGDFSEMIGELSKLEGLLSKVFIKKG